MDLNYKKNLWKKKLKNNLSVVSPHKVLCRIIRAEIFNSLVNIFSSLDGLKNSSCENVYKTESAKTPTVCIAMVNKLCRRARSLSSLKKVLKEMCLELLVL